MRCTSRAIYALDEPRAHVAAPVRHQLVGSANWYALQGHWARLRAAVLAITAVRRGA